MPRATPYVRLYDFSDFQTTNPSRPLPGSELDAELDALRLTTDGLRGNAAQIQRDDGALANGVVTVEALAPGALALIGQGQYHPRGQWVAGTPYEAGDVVEFNLSTYLALSDHVALPAFADDRAAGRWLLLANAALTGSAATVDLFSGDGVTTDFVLSTNYANSLGATVFVGGVAQIPGQDFTLVNNDLQFLTPPPLPVVPGRKNVMVRGTAVEAQIAASAALQAALDSQGYAATALAHRDAANLAAGRAEIAQQEAEANEVQTLGHMQAAQTARTGAEAAQAAAAASQATASAASVVAVDAQHESIAARNAAIAARNDAVTAAGEASGFKNQAGASATAAAASQAAAGVSAASSQNSANAAAASAAAAQTWDPNQYVPRASSGRRNLVRNGAALVAQRGAAINAPANAAWTLDGWQWLNATGAVVNVSKAAEGPNAQFPYCLKVAVTTADGSLTVSEFAAIRTPIEAVDIHALRNRPVTISFWVKSAKAGTHVLVLRNPATSIYCGTYAVAAANTWEFKTITLAGGLPDASGPWKFAEGETGLQVDFMLGASATFNTPTPNVWQAGSSALAVAGAVNVLDTAGNSFCVTGLQIEPGSVATPYEHVPFTEVVFNCRRYYERARASNIGPCSANLGYGVPIAFKNTKSKVPAMSLVAGTLDVGGPSFHSQSFQTPTVDSVTFFLVTTQSSGIAVALTYEAEAELP